jgi:hypothetical protein
MGTSTHGSVIYGLLAAGVRLTRCAGAGLGFGFIRYWLGLGLDDTWGGT